MLDQWLLHLTYITMRCVGGNSNYTSEDQRCSASSLWQLGSMKWCPARQNVFIKAPESLWIREKPFIMYGYHQTGADLRSHTPLFQYEQVTVTLCDPPPTHIRLSWIEINHAAFQLSQSAVSSCVKVHPSILKLASLSWSSVFTLLNISKCSALQVPRHSLKSLMNWVEWSTIITLDDHHLWSMWWRKSKRILLCPGTSPQTLALSPGS